MKLHTVHAGNFKLDGGAMFGVVPKTLWSKRHQPDENNLCTWAMRCMLIENDGRLILIDNGMGDKQDAKFFSHYQPHGEHTLDGSLSALGFDRGDITDMFLTHLHFDHCGGVTERRGEDLAVAFPSATFHVQQRHWEWARTPNPRERASFLADNLDPIAASGQLALRDGPGELFPGIHLLLADGHTEAQQLVRLEDGERSVVYVADLIPTVAHLPEVWVMGYDIRPLQSMEEKMRLLADAEQKRWSLFFEHDPNVVVAEVVRGRKGFELVHPRSLKDL